MVDNCQLVGWWWLLGWLIMVTLLSWLRRMNYTRIWEPKNHSMCPYKVGYSLSGFLQDWNQLMLCLFNDFKTSPTERNREKRKSCAPWRLMWTKPASASSIGRPGGDPLGVNQRWPQDASAAWRCPKESIDIPAKGATNDFARLQGIIYEVSILLLKKLLITRKRARKEKK